MRPLNEQAAEEVARLREVCAQALTHTLMLAIYASSHMQCSTQSGLFVDPRCWRSAPTPTEGKSNLCVGPGSGRSRSFTSTLGELARRGCTDRWPVAFEPWLTHVVAAAWEHVPVNLTLNFVDGTPLGYQWVEKPFVDTDAFDRSWWLASVLVPSRSRCSFGTVTARLHVPRSSWALAQGRRTRLGTGRKGGVTEIDLIAVKDTFRGGGIGGEALALLVAEYEAPIIALAKNEMAEGFWRKPHGWEEHLQEADEGAHPEAPKAMPLYVWTG